MIATIQHRAGNISVDLSKPIDISIAVSPNGPRAWYVDPMRFDPVLNRFFTGSVKLGGSVNFNNVVFNPHGHGTHTESVGHISNDLVSINQVLKTHFFLTQLITIKPELCDADSVSKQKGDHVISKQQIEKVLGNNRPEALVIRTLPNGLDKLSKNYSDTNFPYIEEEALSFLADIDVKHLLVDLPSVDREQDGGLLKAHHAFWRYPNNTRLDCTITEFVFVQNEIADSAYLMNLQVAAFENDAAPSRPVLYKILDKN